LEKPSQSFSLKQRKLREGGLLGVFRFVERKSSDSGGLMAYADSG
jgi:hypothetical protein